ncbi:14924_t:CDS:2 [Gigaspora rosea]|nr:14924_t:CDS:2 [Gigaspora rosea]
MAKQSDKKIAQENLKCLNNLKWGFIIVNSFGSRTALLYFATLSISIYLGLELNKLGTPRYGPRGNVEWSGIDLSSKGSIDYMFDVIYVTWAVHIGSMFYEGFWLFYLLIPLYALYNIWKLFMNPFSGSEGNVPQEKSKRQKKMEKRQLKQ